MRSSRPIATLRLFARKTCTLGLPRPFIIPITQFNRQISSSTVNLSVTLPQATAEHYTYLKRDPNYKKLDENDIQHFKKILGAGGVITDAEEVATYNVDWMKKYRGNSQLVLRPRTTQQVSEIMKYCNDKNLAVVPQGGNTGLVGGSVPVFDEVIVNLSLMNQVRSFDPVSGVLVADAGLVLEAADQYLAERGYIFPLDLGAKGSCHIGGNVATNAGGLRLLRYGSLHGTVLGLEAVLADGTVLSNLSTLRKDNTGYDLKQLFIGSEGTLGIITGVSILAPKRPKATNVAMLSVKSFQDVQTAFGKAKAELGEILSAFEFWDRWASGLVEKYLSHVRNPLSHHQEDAPFTILIETSGSNKEHDDAKLGQFLENLMADGTVVDGVVAESDAQVQGMWSVREGIPEACSKAGAVYKYDISMPVPVLYQMVEDVTKRLKDNGVFKEDGNGIVKAVIGYGHIGDGNLHLNISCDSYDDTVANLIEPYVYEWARKHNGSISAEHGLGLMKAPHLHYSKSPEMIDLMQQIKKLFDPKAILSPYKFLPSQ